MRFCKLVQTLLVPTLLAGSAMPAFAAKGADVALAKINTALAAGQEREAETLATTTLAEPNLSDLMQRQIHIARALALQAEGRSTEALVDFTVGLSGGPLPVTTRARAFYDRGVLLDELGRLYDALGDYDAAISLNPRTSYALNNRANVYRRLGRITEARRDYLAALALGDGNAQYPYYGLGQIAEVQGNTSAARGFYAQAVTADPSYQPALDRLQELGASTPGQTRPTVIIIHPAPSIVLRAPALAEMSQRAASRPPPPSRVAQQTAELQTQLSGEGAPLRPTIIDRLPKSSRDVENVVQLGAWRSNEEARTGWSRAEMAAPDVLGGLSPLIVAANVPGQGRYFRLRVDPTESAARFCAALAGARVTCIPVRE